MTRKIVLHKASSGHLQPLIHKNKPPVRNNRLGEVAGKTTADCAALCCCCPCGIMNLLVLAVYRLPAGLCRKALKKKQQKRLTNNEGLLAQRRSCACEKTDAQVHPVSSEMFRVENAEKLNDKEVMELEKEMFDKFYSTGFWRSPSQVDSNR